MSTAGKPHKVYKLLGRGPLFCGVPAPWFFGFVIAAPTSFFIFRAIGGLWAGVVGLGLVIAGYGLASIYQQMDPAIVPLAILKLKGIEFPEETTSYLPRSQTIEWKETEDE